MLLVIYHIVTTLIAVILVPVIFIFLPYFSKIKHSFIERLGFYGEKEVKLKRKKNGLRVWIHAVSVGETISTVTFLNAARKIYPDTEWIFSTVTLTGQKIAGEKIKGLYELFYLPFDNIFITEKCVSAASPDIYISFESEFWPSLYHSLHRRKIPILIFNGRISDKSFRNYSKYSMFFKPVFSFVSFFGMQSEKDAEKMKMLLDNPSNVKNIGNLKFAMEIEENALSSFLPEGVYFIAGSTHSGEDEIVLDVFGRLKKKHPSLKLVIAPRHPERFDFVYNLCKNSNFTVTRRSEIKQGFSSDILLLDVMGELRECYRHGTVNFVGGSLVPAGGHNMLEVAYWGKPSVFGSNLFNFKEISEALVKKGGGFSVNDSDEMFTLSLKLIEDKTFFEESGRNAISVFDANQKILKDSLDVLDYYIKKVNR